ncbi:MAG: biotin--[acetyl-CoA-carboxylase] ligase [Proteobacteria bacterium]|nr:biotin--[acetyl-CoA-carboxylase] ligase [Pseudomonadota bacterium]
MPLPPGYTLVALDRVESTQEEAARLLQQGKAKNRTVVTAKSQTKGRGRYGRDWVSAEGNLFASLVLCPAGDLSGWGQLGFVASLAVAEAIRKILPPESKVQLKWPNDVLVDGKKIAGILLEIKSDPQGKDVLILGFGVNGVSHPEQAEIPATDLKEQKAEKTEPEAVLEAVMAAFEGYYELWQEKGFAAIREPWLALAKDLKKEVAVRFAGKEIKGEFVDIGSDDGALYIKKAGGQTERIACGDVYFSHQ